MRRALTTLTILLALAPAAAAKPTEPTKDGRDAHRATAIVIKQTADLLDGKANVGHCRKAGRKLYRCPVRIVGIAQTCTLRVSVRILPKRFLLRGRNLNCRTRGV